jgi:hypothetical protein
VEWKQGDDAENTNTSIIFPHTLNSCVGSSWEGRQLKENRRAQSQEFNITHYFSSGSGAGQIKCRKDTPFLQGKKARKIKK